MRVVKVESAEFPESGRLLCRQLGERWRRIFGEILSAGMEAGEFRRMDVDVAARTISFALVGVAEKVSAFRPLRPADAGAGGDVAGGAGDGRTVRARGRRASHQTRRGRSEGDGKSAPSRARDRGRRCRGAGRRHARRTRPRRAPPPPEVAVVQVEPRRVPTAYEFTGEVQPYRRVEVRARVDGVIESRPFTEGATVKPGQVLYRLDRVRPEAAYRSAAGPLRERQADARSGSSRC